jgi:hypothetical protein
VVAAHGIVERGQSWKGEAAVGCGLGAQELPKKSGKIGCGDSCGVGARKR